MLQLIATSTVGLESVVFQELKKLGVAPRNSDVEVGRTFFEGGFLDLVKANIWLRSAGKVLVKLAEFEVEDDFDVIFDAVRGIEWENWAAPDAAFIVQGRSLRSTITSVPALQRTVKKAIVTRLSKVWKTSTLPETGSRYEVEISLLKNRATITLNSSGRGLHRRGYRLMNVAAPLRETLAAALVLLSVWKRGRPLVDPFCGSGTIPIEAALIGRNIAPGMRRSFDAQNWVCIPQQLWREAREEARDLVLPPLAEKIIGSDIDDKCVALSRHHARLAGIDRDVEFIHRDFKDLQDARDFGCVICNPPYGERLVDSGNLRQLYESIPAVLSRLPTWSHFIFTNWLDFTDLIGQEATRKRKIYNSRIECVYYQFLGPTPPKSFLEKNDAEELQITCIRDDRRENDSINSDIDLKVNGQTSAPCNLPASPQMNLKPAFAGLDDYAEHQALEFGRCLANRARHLRRYPSRGITCYRLYDKDLPEVPLAIDIFEGKWLHIAEYERPDNRTAGQHKLWLEKMVATAAKILEIPLENVFVKRRSRQRGASQYEKLDENGRIIRVREGGLTFLCNMTDHLDVGLFLDHRQTRDMVRREARNARFLNLFCYSGAFTCYAVDGGASSTVSVDLSPSCLEWCKANLDENGLLSPGENVGTPRNYFVKSDAIRFLKAIPPASSRDANAVKLTVEIAESSRAFRDLRQAAESRNFRKKYVKHREEIIHEPAFGIKQSDFDLCVCDPPTFSNSKSVEIDWDVQRRHAELLGILATRMKPGGVVYFSSNFRRFKLDEEYLKRLYYFREITNRTIPDDFRNKHIHRCWRMVAK